MGRSKDRAAPSTSTRRVAGFASATLPEAFSWRLRAARSTCAGGNCEGRSRCRCDCSCPPGKGCPADCRRIRGLHLLRPEVAAHVRDWLRSLPFAVNYARTLTDPKNIELVAVAAFAYAGLF